ncbi:hypothetical protein HXX76_007883 [Chlamydomonas incerta]|uniref:Purple acid phosphatase n=1 Tax=Chlamydomonas incerta TaxID=51695 RepID=A0A835W318_CHLIN|nr:hypothetical protein HXX76_007883 [Chlamydomonas incerta]|eukprot:KAG2434156.1 hypothetical protein HXX76_007883 [Chlamydomonas incerta]
MLSSSMLVSALLALFFAAAHAGITVRHPEIAALYGSSQPEAASAFAELGGYALPKNSSYLQPPAEGKVEQVVVNYHSAGEVVVSWVVGHSAVCNDYTCAAVPVAPAGSDVVRYGTTRSSLKSRAYGAGSYYTQDYYFPASLNVTGVSDSSQFNYTSARIYSARLTGLKSATRYYYCLGKDSAVRSFKTTPRKGAFPLRIGSMADIGNSVNATETIRKMGLSTPDLLLIVGDFAYANIFDFRGAFNYGPVVARGLTYSYQPRWDTLGRMMEGVTGRVPVLTTQGNHEMELQSDGSMFKSWLTRFGWNSPYSKSEGTPFYYSANVGPVHVLSISPYVDFVPGTPQYDWLVRDLSSVDRSVTPWVVAMWHAPWYHTFVSHYKELECHRLAVEPLLYKYGVNVALHGHVHGYERTLKVYNQVEDACGTVYLTAGNAGVGLNTEFADSDSLTRFSRPTSFDPASNCTRPVQTNATLIYIAGGKICPTVDPVSGKYCPNTQPAWSARREAAHGFVTLDFLTPTRAVIKYFRNLAPDGEATESVELTRDLSCPNQSRKPRFVQRQ